MSDNTILNIGGGGDTIRTIQKTVNAPVKTEVVVLDVGGGADSSLEAIVGATSAAPGGVSLPVSDVLLQQLLHINTQILAVLRAMQLQDASFQGAATGTPTMGVAPYIEPTDLLNDTFN